MGKMLLQIDFPFAGPWGETMAKTLTPLARDIATEPGLLWKIWMENQNEGRAGGIHLFVNEAALDRFMEKHVLRLSLLGITEYRALKFHMSDALSEMTHMPLDTVAV